MALLQECPRCRYKNPMHTWEKISLEKEVKRGKIPVKLCKCGFKIGKASGKTYWIEYYENGQRKRERIGPNKEAAEHRLRDVLKARTEERYIEKDPASRLSLGEICEWYLKLPEVKAKDSFIRDEEFTQHLKRILGESIKIKYITPGKLESYQQQRLSEPSPRHKGETIRPATVNKEITCLKTIFNRAVRHKKLIHNPITRIKRLPENNIRMRVLSTDEFKKLVDACPIHIEPIVEMAFYMGLRRSEITELTWAEVDLQRGFVRLSAERTKSDQARAIPIHPIVEETLKKLPRGLHTDRVFLLNGVSFEEFRKAFKKACKNAGIMDFTFHDLRHCALNNLRLAGNDYFKIMALSGHRTMSCFKRYNLVTEEELKGIKWSISGGNAGTMDTYMDTKQKGAAN